MNKITVFYSIQQIYLTEYQFFDEFFTVIFKREQSDGGLSGGLNDELQNLLLIIKNNQGLNAYQLKNISNIPQRTLERWLQELKALKLIGFKGSKKTGGYYAI